MHNAVCLHTQMSLWLSIEEKPKDRNQLLIYSEGLEIDSGITKGSSLGSKFLYHERYRYSKL